MAKPVVALDIDGTLGGYHEHFIRFAADWTGKEMPPLCEMEGGQPFFRFLGMSKHSYRECKLAFRQGGMHRSMPVFEGAVSMVRDFRRAGAEVWLCTTRPYLRYDRLAPDTRHWLSRHRIRYDGILYGTHKYADLVKNVGGAAVVAVLDDLPEQCTASATLELPTYMHDRPYNRGMLVDIPRVRNYIEDQWRDRVVEEIHRRVKECESGSSVAIRA